MPMPSILKLVSRLQSDTVSTNCMPLDWRTCYTNTSRPRVDVKIVVNLNQYVIQPVVTKSLWPMSSDLVDGRGKYMTYLDIHISRRSIKVMITLSKKENIFNCYETSGFLTNWLV